MGRSGLRLAVGATSCTAVASLDVAKTGRNSTHFALALPLPVPLALLLHTHLALSALDSILDGGSVLAGPDDVVRAWLLLLLELLLMVRLLRRVRLAAPLTAPGAPARRPVTGPRPSV